jgi:hypothetical protein
VPLPGFRPRSFGWSSWSLSGRRVDRCGEGRFAKSVQPCTQHAGSCDCFGDFTWTEMQTSQTEIPPDWKATFLPLFSRDPQSRQNEAYAMRQWKCPGHASPARASATIGCVSCPDAGTDHCIGCLAHASCGAVRQRIISTQLSNKSLQSIMNICRWKQHWSLLLED